MIRNMTFKELWSHYNESDKALMAEDDYISNRPSSSYIYNDTVYYSTPVDYVFDWKASLYRAVVPIMILFCVIAVITNLSILMSVRWIRRNLSPTLCFSVSLAVADAYASLVVGIGLLVNSLLPIAFEIHVSSLCLALTLEGFRLAGLIVSVLHLLLLAVNHYIGIIRPLHYASTMTRGKAMLNIALMWTVPIIFFFVYFASVTNQGFQAEKCSRLEFIVRYEFRYITGGLFFIPLILMFFMYVHIFIIVIRHNRGLSQYQGSRNFRHNVKAATTTLLILGTYTVGWMPAVLFYVTVCYDCTVVLGDVDPTVLVSVTMMINTLIILKLTVNPIIYAARMKEISGAMKRMSAMCHVVFGESNEVGGTGTGVVDDVSHSSFIRSRSDTMYTTIRMQSVAGGRNNKGTRRKDEPSPILVYQKCDKRHSNNSLHNSNCATHKSASNGIAKSASNGVKSKDASPTTNNETMTSPIASANGQNKCLLYTDNNSNSG